MPIVAAAALTAGGALLASNSASKAASKSAQASQNATDQATAEQRRQYDQSRADYAPYLQVGTGALNQLAGLYGIPSTQQPQGQAQITQYGQPVGGQRNGLSGRFDMLGDLQVPQTMEATAGTGQQGQAQVVPENGAGNMAGFFQSPDYQFRLNEGARALTARNAALGIQDSGAAQRSAIQYAGNLASGEFNNYANRLSALAGVGQTTAQNNAALGQNYAGAVGQFGMNNAQNLASSYQQQAQAQQGLYGGLVGVGTGLINQMWPVKK
jgi:hypothetical protein